jgi:bacterioferritin
VSTEERRVIMVLTKEELLKELNKDLEWEYAAAIQYIQHAAVIRGAKYESISKELLIHSQEEMQHATMLSDPIDFLGGKPTVEVERRDFSKDSLEMLKQDLWGEDNAIARYTDEELKEYGLRRILEHSTHRRVGRMWFVKIGSHSD